MSLKPELILEVPEMTVEIARKAFPKGNVLLTLRDELGVIFRDEDFSDLFPKRGQPALAPWRLALVTLLQFREQLSDRQAAEAVRSRIDWKYLLGLELTDPGFDFSVLSEFRTRLLEGKAEVVLLEKLLALCQERKLLRARGKQRTDSTYVLAAIRVMNRLEQVCETLRAALNEIATVAPDWLQQVAPQEWYVRYSRRIEDYRLPQQPRERAAYAQTVGEDGFHLLDLVAEAEAPLADLATVETLGLVWERHYERQGGQVRFRSSQEIGEEAPDIESPYDTEARYRKHRAMDWVGYLVHVSESCDEELPHLITHVDTTLATVHEAQRTAAIQQALLDKGLPPEQHLVDAAYVAAELLVDSQQEQGITLRGPTRQNSTWQAKVAGGYDTDQFMVDWEAQVVRCPQGKQSVAWHEREDGKGVYIRALFHRNDCRPCPARSLCTRSQVGARSINLKPRPQFEALQAARHWQDSPEGKQFYNRRAGVEGTISQAVRGFGLRQTRYCGIAKTHLQHLAIAAAMNIERLIAWLNHVPRAPTRTSRFAALAT